MSDLAAFLLERIAEDEARYRETAGDERNQQWAMQESPDFNEGYIVAEALRMLAECAAKRRIVELAADVLALEDRRDHDGRYGPRRDAPYLDDLILRALASVYADHPLFQEEWR